MPYKDPEKQKQCRLQSNRKRYQRAFERELYKMRTVVELVDPPSSLKIGGTFAPSYVKGITMRVTGIAPPCIRPSAPSNVCVLVELFERARR